MSAMKKPNVGLVTVSMAGERVDLAEQFHNQTLPHLLSLNLNVISISSVHLTAEDVMGATQHLVGEGAESIIYLIGTWVYAPSIVTALSRFDIPAVIWGLPDPASFSSVGANVVHGSLEELGIAHKLVYGFPDEQDVLNEIGVYTRAAKVKSMLRGSKFGLIGGRSIGMYPSTADPIQVKRVFGIEIEHVDQLLLVEYAKEIPDEEAQLFYEQVKLDYNRIDVPDDVMIKSIKLYFALQRVVEEYGFSFIGVKCLEELINRYVSCCLAISLLNNSGMVTACQSDINAAIAMKILYTLTGSPTIFADLNHINKQTKVARLVNCGTLPTALAKSLKDVDWGYQYEYMGKARGACPVFCCQAGEITFGGLSRIKGEYVFQIASGQVFEQPREMLGEVRDIWPQAFVRLDPDIHWFYQNLRSNHIVAGYGDVQRELFELCTLLGVTPIVYAPC